MMGGSQCSEEPRCIGATVGGAPGEYEHASRPPTWTEGNLSERECGDVWMVPRIGQDDIRKGHCRERETRLPMHARRPQQCAPPSIDRVVKRTGFTRSTGSAPHPPRSIAMAFCLFSVFNFCFFAVSNSTTTDSSGCLHSLRESSLESWVRCLHSIYSTYIIYTKVSFGASIYTVCLTVEL